MEVLFLIGGFVLGVIAVLIIQCIVVTTGEFRLNLTDAEEDYMSLHIDNQDHLLKKKYLVLKIVRTSEEAQK